MAVTCCDISTHALTEGDVSRKYFCNRSPRISTHALTEGDIPYLPQCFYFRISTHALTEGDVMMAIARTFDVFQLTPSRRATALSCNSCCNFSFQLTPSRRATHSRRYCVQHEEISTHALTEGDAPEDRD